MGVGVVVDQKYDSIHSLESIAMPERWWLEYWKIVRASL